MVNATHGLVEVDSFIDVVVLQFQILPGVFEVLIQRVRMREYRPATVDGAPVAVYLTSTYTF